MINFCQYKHAFGEPGEGIHQYRIFDLGVIDIVATLFLAYAISYLTGFSMYYVVPAVFLLGIFVHRLFCVRTKIDRILFPNSV